MNKIFFVLLAGILMNMPIDAMKVKPTRPTVSSQCDNKSTTPKKPVFYPNNIRFGN